MAIVHSDQRRPFVIDSSGDTDALSSRLYKRLTHNVNNLITYCARPTVILQHWPGGQVHGTTGEAFVAQFPGRIIPPFYREIRFVLGAVQTAGGGGGAANVTVRLRIYRTLHRGGGTGVLIGTGTALVNQGVGNGHRQISGTVDISSILPGNRVYPVVTAQSNDGAASATLYTLKAWARVAA